MLFSIDLVGPLMTHPVTEMDKTVIKLQLKYRTCIVEYDTEDIIFHFPSFLFFVFFCCIPLNISNNIINLIPIYETLKKNMHRTG